MKVDKIKLKLTRRIEQSEKNCKLESELLKRENGIENDEKRQIRLNCIDWLISANE